MVQQKASITDYVGRTVDIAAYKGWEVGGRTQVEQALVLPGQSGELIAGIEKLVQRFAIELLTEEASLTYLPSRGSIFMTNARQGYWRTSGDVQASFTLALLSVTNNLQAEESLDDPDDERFSSAELVSISLFGDEVTMSVKIVSLAGTAFTALLPLTVSPY